MAENTMQFAAGASPAVTLLPPLPEPGSAEEINHRIANSLQRVSAMISLETRAVEDPAALAVLKRARLRISAIAGVHRQLYRER